MKFKSDQNPNITQDSPVTIICEDGYYDLRSQNLTISCDLNSVVSINSNTPCDPDSIFCNVT